MDAIAAFLSDSDDDDDLGPLDYDLKQGEGEEEDPDTIQERARKRASLIEHLITVRRESIAAIRQEFKEERELEEDEDEGLELQDEGQEGQEEGQEEGQDKGQELQEEEQESQEEIEIKIGMTTEEKQVLLFCWFAWQLLLLISITFTKILLSLRQSAAEM